MRRVPRRPAVVWLLALALIVAVSACARPSDSLWQDALGERERAEVLRDLPSEARASLVPLSEIFYQRITSRRFDSRATFEDPSVRQFFPTVAAYSDYYAALVDALDRAHIRFNRPTVVELLGIEAGDGDSLRLSLRFIGRNDLPLRWWNATLLRTDQWRWQDGRWWVVPGKV